MLGLIEAPPRTRHSTRLASVLARRRAFIFAPMFGLAVALAYLRPTPLPRPVVVSALSVIVLCWLLRIYATGYRTWVHTSGVDRYLMSAGPYAYVRHPLYVANGLAGAAALVVAGQLEILAVYMASYFLVTGAIVRREESALDERFGAGHSVYRARVPAFFPLPGRSVPPEARKGRFSWEPVRRSFEVWKLAVIIAGSAWIVAHS
jgi:protein-S-isoprenylcysteine O-methyltransferase Ste14